MLKKLIILAIALLLNCLNGCLWAQTDNCPSTGNVTQTDTSKISIDIKYIKSANIKLIERLYLKQVLIRKDSIISFKDLYIDNQKIIIKDFQNKLITANQINLNLKKDINKQTNKKKFWKWTAIGIGIIGGTYIICK